MRVVVEKPFGRYSIGAIIPEMPGNQARTLIARGLVREEAEYETRPDPAPQNRMMKAPRARKDNPGLV